MCYDSPIILYDSCYRYREMVDFGKSDKIKISGKVDKSTLTMDSDEVLFPIKNKILLNP